MLDLFNKSFTVYRKTDVLFEGDITGSTTISSITYRAPFRLEVKVPGVSSLLGTLTIVGSTTEVISINDPYEIGVKDFTSITSIEASTTMSISLYSRDSSGNVLYGWQEWNTGKGRLSNYSAKYGFLPYGETDRARYVLFTDLSGIQGGDLIEVDDITYRVTGVYDVPRAQVYHHSQVELEERKEEDLT